MPAGGCLLPSSSCRIWPFSAISPARELVAIAYNITHSLIGPGLLLLAALLLPGAAAALPVTLIWIAHIGIDRALGYGLKYGAGFGFTHLGRIGRTARDGGDS